MGLGSGGRRNRIYFNRKRAHAVFLLLCLLLPFPFPLSLSQNFLIYFLPHFQIYRDSGVGGI